MSVHWGVNEAEGNPMPTGMGLSRNERAAVCRYREPRAVCRELEAKPNNYGLSRIKRKVAAFARRPSYWRVPPGFRGNPGPHGRGNMVFAVLITLALLLALILKLAGE